MSCFKIEFTNIVFSWTIPQIRYGRVFNSSKNLFLIVNNTLSAFPLINGTELWRQEFSTPIQKIEVWEERVVLVVTYGNYVSNLYACDILTGDLLWEKPNMSIEIKIIENKCYGIAVNHTSLKLVELNPLDISHSIEFDLTQIFIQELGKIENFKYTIQDDVIYFSILSRKILLVINFQQSELLWRYDFAPPTQPRSHWIDEPKVSGNRIYILDEENTLHIFERDDGHI